MTASIFARPVGHLDLLWRNVCSDLLPLAVQLVVFLLVSCENSSCIWVQDPYHTHGVF